MEKSVSTLPVNELTLLAEIMDHKVSSITASIASIGLETSRIIELGGVGRIGKGGEHSHYGRVWMGLTPPYISSAMLPFH
jgi:hypothetical protein